MMVELPKKLLVKPSADGRWLLLVPENSEEWKFIADMSLVKEALRLPNFSAWAFFVQEKR